MKTEKKSTPDKNKKNSISIALYVGGSIVALMGLALLFNNIKLYSDTFSQAVAMGYDASQVNAQLLPSQLLPGLFESIGLYGGLSILLFCTGLIYQKASPYMNQSASDEINRDSFELNGSKLTETDENTASADENKQSDEEKLSTL